MPGGAAGMSSPWPEIAPIPRQLVTIRQMLLFAQPCTEPKYLPSFLPSSLAQTQQQWLAGVLGAWGRSSPGVASSSP